MASESEKSRPKESLPANAAASVMTGSLAREIHVTATGARPGTNAANRALFNEETTSVLISDKGGVIRLSSAVVTGQLVFLANNESHREVVSQVIRVRSYRPTTCYVEVEFTEPAPGFWGVDFKAESAQAPQDPKQLETIAAVRAAKPAVTETRARAITPTDKEVSALKDEVSALRQQLKLLQTQAALPKSPAPSPQNPPAPVLNSAPVVPPPVPAATPVAPQPPAAPSAEPQPPTWSTRLPLDPDLPPASAEFYVSQSASSVEHSVATDVSSPRRLPAPAQRTRFPRGSPLSSKKSAKARGSFTPGVQTLVRRILVPAVTLLAIAAVIAWRAPMILFLITGKAAPASSASAKAVPKSASPAPMTAPAVPVSDARKLAATPGVESPALPEGLTPPSAAAPAISGGKIEVAVVSPDTSDKTGDKFLDASVIRKSAVRNGAHARGPKINPTQVTISDLSSVSTDDPAIVPPQLVKSVKAVAPPDALRRFFTGNVLVQAVVGASGRVISAKAVAGPPSLYQAAIDTLKEYRFAPARRNGKAIPARIELTINFWFEP